MSLVSKMATAVRVLREDGWARFAELTRQRLWAPPLRCLFRAVKSRQTFRFCGDEYPYCLAAYTFAWGNERTVEVPIFRRLLQAEAGRVLEVGHVLGHYFASAHTVVDRYEQSPGVINEDVADYHPEQPFDLIVSISVLVHIGADEQPPQPEKALLALANLRECLAPGGQLLFSVPLGQNPHLDEVIRDGRLAVDSQWCLRRVSVWNHWAVTDLATALARPYNHRHRRAEAIFIGSVRRPPA